MKKWRLLVAYDGSSFVGWQRQKNGVAIQHLIEQALYKIFRKPITLYGASRTDTGVHALGQVAHFLQPLDSRKFTAQEILRAINAHLPPTIRILKVYSCRTDFHARFSAKRKRYCYRIINRLVFPPLELGRAWHVPLPLNMETMQRGADYLIGRHDFAPFAVRSKTERENTIRTVTKIEIKQRGMCWLIRVEGDGFLYRMVRSIVGALVHVGLGKQSPTWIRERLKQKNRLPGIITAPPQGLYLLKIFY